MEFNELAIDAQRIGASHPLKRYFHSRFKC